MGRIAFFAAGIWLGVEQSSLLPVFVLLSLMLAAGVVMWRCRRPSVQFICVLLLGFVWLQGHGHWRLADRFPAALHRVEMLCEGQVLDPPELSAARWRFVFALDRCLVEQGWQPMDQRVRVTWYRPEATTQPPRGGERWQLSVKLKLPRGRQNPHGFDYETWLFQRGFHATGYIRDAALSQRLQRAPLWSIAAWRDRLRQRLLEVLPEHPAAGVIPALVLADRSAIEPAMWQRFRDAGTGHLLAISGLHVGLVAAFGALFGRVLWRFLAVGRTERAVWMGAGSLILAFVYAGLAGFALPTVRALIMLSAAIWALLGGRHRRGTDILASAFVVLLLFDPFSVLSAGFWLSFCSVAGIVMGLSGRAHWSRWKQLLWVNAAMGLVLAPLSYFIFSQLAWWCSPANLLVVPVFSFVVVPLSLLGSLLAVLNLPGAEWLLSAAAVAIGLCDSWQAWLLALPQPTLALVGWAPVGLLLVSWLVLMPALWRGASALLLAALVLVCSPRQSDLPSGGFVLSVLDVGHGLAVLVETQRHLLVYDTGPGFGGAGSSGDSVITPALRGQGWLAPDIILISHEDGDHRGGLPALQRVYPDTPVIRGPEGGCQLGRQWQWDGVNFQIVHPVRVWSQNNNNSCVLRVSSAAGSVMLPGDIERVAEERMLERGGVLKSDVLIVPHHGSKTSSSARWLAAIEPDIAVVSVARDSRWAMPHEPVLNRLNAAGIQLYSTGTSGAVVLRFDFTLGSPSVLQLREQKRRFWHLP